MVEIDGEKRVPPECMDLLVRFGQHREFCPQCEIAFRKQDGNGYCNVGREILVKLADQPEVEPM